MDKRSDSEERFRDFAELASDWFWETDSEHRFTAQTDEWIAPQFKQIMATAGKTRFDFRPADDADDEKWERHRADLKAHRPFRNFMFRGIGLDGAPIHVRISGKPIFDSAGNFVGYRGIGSDITELKRADEALKKSEQRFRDIAESVADWVWETDEEHRFTFITDRYFELVGYERQTVIGKTRWKSPAHHHDPEAIIRLSAILDEHRPYRNFLLQLRRADGSVMHTISSGKPVFDEGGAFIGYCGTGADNAEREQVERDLLRSQQRLRDLAMKLSMVEEQERRRLAAYVHDRIGQGLALLRLKCGALAAAPAALNLGDAFVEVRQIVADLIDDAQKLSFDLSSPVLYELGLGPAVEQAGERICREHGLDFEYRDDDDHGPMDDHSAVLLLRCARELLMNVAKHAGASRVRVDMRRSKSEIRLTVEDDGVGFDVSELETGVMPEHFGIFSIRESMRYIGGSFVIRSAPEAGTCAGLIVPLDAPEGG